MQRSRARRRRPGRGRSRLVAAYGLIVGSRRPARHLRAFRRCRRLGRNVESHLGSAVPVRSTASIPTTTGGPHAGAPAAASGPIPTTATPAIATNGGVRFLLFPAPVTHSHARGSAADERYQAKNRTGDAAGPATVEWPSNGVPRPMEGRRPGLRGAPSAGGRHQGRCHDVTACTRARSRRSTPLGSRSRGDRSCVSGCFSR